MRNFAPTENMAQIWVLFSDVSLDLRVRKTFQNTNIDILMRSGAPHELTHEKAYGNVSPGL